MADSSQLFTHESVLLHFSLVGKEAAAASGQHGAATVTWLPANRQALCQVAE